MLVLIKHDLDSDIGGGTENLQKSGGEHSRVKMQHGIMNTSLKLTIKFKLNYIKS